MKQDQEQLERFFAEAVTRQRGGYYPETHLQNVNELTAEFQWPEAVVDSLYRIACHFGYDVKRLGDDVVKGNITFQEAKEQIEFPIYYYIPADYRKEELEMALDSSGYAGDFDREWSERDRTPHR